MKRFASSLLLALASTAALVACGDKPASFDTLETERGTARKNALFNAQVWRGQSPIYKDWDIVGRGDSSQTADCSVGDGWATMSFFSPDKAKTVDVKCSTVSGNVGCLTAIDFKSKPYASEDGQCQKGKLPTTLPNISK